VSPPWERSAGKGPPGAGTIGALRAGVVPEVSGRIRRLPGRVPPDGSVALGRWAATGARGVADPGPIDGTGLPQWGG
jgi:hypothetical protein